MATLLAPSKPLFTFQSLRLIARTSPHTFRRAISTLPNNSHIYIHPQPNTNNHLLSYLPTSPPNATLAIGTTSQIPPTPESFTENHEFLQLLHTVLAAHAAEDPDVHAQAALYASQAGSALGTGGVFFPQHQQPTRKSDRRGAKKPQGDGAGGASNQGGMGGAGRGGWIHVSDQRNPPDFGRVAWPEDIFGSLEIDGQGKFVEGTGRYQASGTYRVVTREGVLGLSPYLREQVVEKLKELEGKMKA